MTTTAFSLDIDARLLASVTEHLGSREAVAAFLRESLTEFAWEHDLADVPEPVDDPALPKPRRCIKSGLWFRPTTPNQRFHPSVNTDIGTDW